MADELIEKFISLKWSDLLFPIVLSMVLGGCASSSIERTNDIAKKGGMEFIKVSTPLFSFASYQRINDSNLPLHLYIEGDGRAWLSRTQPSPDPTPTEPTALRLAVLDPAANVVYLARPCQWVPMAENPRCQPTYWTNKRFSPEVILAMSEAITQIKQQSHNQQVALVGYSGGGAVASLLAQSRDDIISLRTVAGYLDVEYANAWHHVSPMPDSLNPIKRAHTIAGLAQIHFSGSEDTVIPPAIAQRYVAQTGGQCARQIIVADMTHRGPWEKRWPQLLTIPPVCSRQPLAYSRKRD